KPDGAFYDRAELPNLELHANPASANLSINTKYLHHFVPKMIDHLHGEAAALRDREGPRDFAVERRPDVRIDLRLERGLERAVRIVLAEEVRVADEEALFVVVGMDEPAGDAAASVAADLTRRRL